MTIKYCCFLAFFCIAAFISYSSGFLLAKEVCKINSQSSRAYGSLSDVSPITSYFKENLKKSLTLCSTLLLFQLQAKNVLSDDFTADQLKSDEFVINFNNPSIGLKLQEIPYKGYSIIGVKQILDKTISIANPQLKEGAIVTKIGKYSLSSLSLKDVAEIIKTSERPLVLHFRDPNMFLRLLDSSNSDSDPLPVVTTTVLPANPRKGLEEQVLKVERIQTPTKDKRTKSAQNLDVLELQFTAQVLGQKEIVDSSLERANPAATNKNFYYVLGQRDEPLAKFPAGLDLSLSGMVVGEERKITIPYPLGFGPKGDENKKIPPFSTVVYNVKLVSIA